MIDLKHSEQLYSWDCGLACARMVLSYLGHPHDDVYGNDLQSLGCKHSIWTVDLAHLMAIRGITHTMCTISTEVDKTYANKSFYVKQFNEDESRVNSLFENARDVGINIDKRRVEVDEIHGHLTSGNILISLVNYKLLQCNWCDSAVLSTLKRIGCMNYSYAGHFIVVCGYDAAEKLVYYKNPNRKSELCCISEECFEAARTSHGTDEDLLFVYHGPTLDTQAVQS